MQIDIQQRMPRCNHIHKDGPAARFQYPANFAQRLADVMPVVRRVTADHHIKAGIVKRQRFCHALLHLNVVETFILRRLAYHIQHLRR
ncbi:hypothetical protein D3C80_1263470 [compost metagenome]